MPNTYWFLKTNGCLTVASGMFIGHLWKCVSIYDRSLVHCVVKDQLQYQPADISLFTFDPPAWYIFNQSIYESLRYSEIREPICLGLVILGMFNSLQNRCTLLKSAPDVADEAEYSTQYALWLAYLKAASTGLHFGLSSGTRPLLTSRSSSMHSKALATNAALKPVGRSQTTSISQEQRGAQNVSTSQEQKGLQTASAPQELGGAQATITTPDPAEALFTVDTRASAVQAPKKSTSRLSCFPPPMKPTHILTGRRRSSGTAGHWVAKHTHLPPQPPTLANRRQCKVTQTAFTENKPLLEQINTCLSKSHSTAGATHQSVSKVLYPFPVF